MHPVVTLNAHYTLEVNWMTNDKNKLKSLKGRNTKKNGRYFCFKAKQVFFRFVLLCWLGIIRLRADSQFMNGNDTKVWLLNRM